MQASRIHSRLDAQNVRPYDMGQQITEEAVVALRRIGIVMDAAIVRQQVNALTAVVGDSAFTPPTTTPSIATPIQFLQAWLPGFISVMTAARKIDEIIGVLTVGEWRDREIVQGVREFAGTPSEYGDYTNVPLASWNVNWERRSIVRVEMGMQVGLLEEETAAAMRMSSADAKRTGVGNQLEIIRNAIGFRGWNNGNNRTFGLLNDPNLPAYITVPGGTWVAKGYTEICNDLRLAFQRLRTQTMDNVDPMTEPTTMVLPTNRIEQLNTATEYGYSVRKWLTDTYPKCRIVSAPELIGANGGADVMYLFPEKLNPTVDGSTDGGAVFDQLVQTKFITLGVEKRVKSYIEDYANATAGVLLKRPFAVVRLTGI